MKLWAIGTLVIAMVLMGCATREAPHAMDDAPGCRSELSAEAPSPYRCVITPEQPTAVTERTARDGSPYFELAFDHAITLQFSALDGRGQLLPWERHCQSPAQRAQDIARYQRAMAESELTCLIDRTLKDSNRCPDDWYWVNPDGSAPLSAPPARQSDDRLVTYVACVLRQAFRPRLLWPNAGRYLTLEYASIRLSSSLPCLTGAQCAADSRVGYRGVGNGFDVAYGRHLTHYLIWETGVLWGGEGWSNQSTSTVEERSAIMQNYIALRTGLRVQYPLASRAAVFARYALGYHSAVFDYGGTSPFSDITERAASHWMRDILAGAEIHLGGPVALRAAYAVPTTSGGLRRALWTAGLILSE